MLSYSGILEIRTAEVTIDVLVNQRANGSENPDYN